MFKKRIIENFQICFQKDKAEVKNLKTHIQIDFIGKNIRNRVKLFE